MIDSVSALFSTIVQIDSPTGEEASIAKYVFNYLQSLGCEPQLDANNNVFAHIKGTGEPVLLNAHLDTVEPGKKIIPIIKNGIIKSNGKTIVGADNKVSVAAILAAVTYVHKHAIQHRPIDVLFTTSEEVGNYGALAFDFSKIKAKIGFIFDKEGDLGEIISCSPYYARFNISIIGKSAHAAYREHSIPVIESLYSLLQSIEYMRTKELLINVGKIIGGTTRNTVMGDCYLEGEIRSFKQDIFSNAIEELKNFCKDTLPISIDCEIVIENKGYIHSEQNLKMISNVLETVLEKKLTITPSYGCSDANIFNDKTNIKVFNLSDGSYLHHTTDEYVPITNLEKLVEIITHILTTKESIKI